MLANLRTYRLSHTAVAAYLALFVALGGTGYAAVKINGKDIKNRTVSGTKLKKKTLTGLELRSGVAAQNVWRTKARRGTTAVGVIALEKRRPASYETVDTISFPFPLPSKPKIVQLRPGQTAAGCTGSPAKPTAAAGYLCIYYSSLTGSGGEVPQAYAPAGSERFGIELLAVPTYADNDNVNLEVMGVWALASR